MRRTADATYRVAHEVAVEDTRVATQIWMRDRQQMLFDFRAERVEFRKEFLAAIEKVTADQKQWSQNLKDEQKEWMRINNCKLVTMLATSIGCLILFADHMLGYSVVMVRKQHASPPLQYSADLMRP